MENYLKQIEIGRIVEILGGDNQIHTRQITNICGPTVTITWLSPIGKVDYFIDISKRKLARLMCKAHMKRIEDSNNEYQSGALGWD